MPQERIRNRYRGDVTAILGGISSVLATGSAPGTYIPPTVAPHATPIRVPKDYPTLQEAFDAEVVGQGYREISAITGTISTTTASEVVTGAGTAFLSEIEPGDTIAIGSNEHTVRDITNDASLRLYHGASANTAGVTAEVRKHTKITLYFESDGDTIAGTIPDGVSLQIIGSEIRKRVSASVGPSLRVSQNAHIEFHNWKMVCPLGSAQFLIGADLVLGRSIVKASQLLMDRRDLNSGGFGFVTGAAIILNNISGINWKAALFSDYMTIDNVGATNTFDDDIMLLNCNPGGSSTDLAYEHEINNYTIYKLDGTNGGFNGGLEWNTFPAGKVCNVRNSLINNANATLSYPVWGPFNGTVNFFDSFIDSQTALEEVDLRGGTVNFNNTFRLDGVTIPRTI